MEQAGWNFDNSYARLPEHFYARMKPVKVSDPRVVVVNLALADELGLPLGDYSEEELAQLFCGNVLPDNAEPIAQAYAGHQFGCFAMLGDGRAHLIGEQVTPNGRRVDIQLKGSGRTPYGRRGDGRAALGPMLREYIISEAMHALGIATTRSLAVIATGEPVYRDKILKGAILARVASSHLRVGTFEFLAAREEIVNLKQLADYSIKRHYPEVSQSDQPYLDFLKAVTDRQVSLVVDWLRVGFIHGVMNTDNMTISGETIDYGPCAFMDEYNPRTVFSSIDRTGRYAFANQPQISRWNLARLAQALLPLLHKDIDQAVALAQEVIETHATKFEKTWLAMMRNKLGLFGQEQDDSRLIDELLQWLQRNKADYTNSFRDLISENIPDAEPYNSAEFEKWWQRWQIRLKRQPESLESSFRVMTNNNPAIIPRNHKVEEALYAAEEHTDFAKLHKLLDALSSPHHVKPEYTDYLVPPRPEERVHQTFCGT